MKLGNISESVSDRQLVKLINHEYSPLPSSMRDRFTRALVDGVLPDHNRSYVLSVARGVQAAIALDGDYSADSGVLAIVDGYNIRGAVLFLGVAPNNAMRAYKRLVELESGEVEANSGDWWKQEEVTGIDDSDDVGFLGVGGDWSESNVIDDIAQLKVFYPGVLKSEYLVSSISSINNTIVLMLCDDEFELAGLRSLVKSKLDIKAWGKMPQIQSDIDKYVLRVVDFRS